MVRARVDRMKIKFIREDYVTQAEAGTRMPTVSKYRLRVLRQIEDTPTEGAEDEAT